MTNKTYNVFIVEDDPTYRKMFSFFLNERFGSDNDSTLFNVTSFESGEEMMKGLKNESPDIVFMDFYLNGYDKNAMNGKIAMRELKKQTPETEVVIISAKDTAINTVDLFKYGASDYLDKKYIGVSEVKELLDKLVMKIERKNYAL